ncbi:MAG: TylF/MycF/NovP-related O-methyltransferase [Pseudomonadota bacterium]
MTDLRTRYIETLKALILNDVYLEAEAERTYLIDVADGNRPFDPAEFYSGGAAHPETIQAIADSHRTGRHFDGRLKFATIGASMIGRARMDNLHMAVETVIRERVPGDIIECGVWRGGAMAFATGVLDAHDDTRTVWLADSFQGLPVPNHEADTIDLRTTRYPMLAIPEDRVRKLFGRLGLLDDRIEFLPGWFEDTLPDAPIDQISVLRLDADYYASTMTALDALYPKVSPGGFVIVDDYGVLEPARLATDEFRAAHSVAAPLVDIDGAGVYWRR